MPVEGILKRLARKRAREEGESIVLKAIFNKRQKKTARKSTSSAGTASTYRSNISRPVITIDSSSSEEEEDTTTVKSTTKVPKENTVNSISEIPWDTKKQSPNKSKSITTPSKQQKQRKNTPTTTPTKKKAPTPARSKQQKNKTTPSTTPLSTKSQRQSLIPSKQQQQKQRQEEGQEKAIPSTTPLSSSFPQKKASTPARSKQQQKEIKTTPSTTPLSTKSQSQSLTPSKQQQQKQRQEKAIPSTTPLSSSSLQRKRNEVNDISEIPWDAKKQWPTKTKTSTPNTTPSRQQPQQQQQQRKSAPSTTPLSSSSPQRKKKTPRLPGTLKQKMRIRSSDRTINTTIPITTNMKDNSSSPLTPKQIRHNGISSTSTPSRKFTQQKLPSSIDQSSVSRKHATPKSPSTFGSSSTKNQQPQQQQSSRRKMNTPPSLPFPSTTQTQTQNHKSISDDSDENGGGGNNNNNIEIIELSDSSPCPSPPPPPPTLLPHSSLRIKRLKESTKLLSSQNKKNEKKEATSPPSEQESEDSKKTQINQASTENTSPSPPNTEKKEATISLSQQQLIDTKKSELNETSAEENTSPSPTPPSPLLSEEESSEMDYLLNAVTFATKPIAMDTGTTTDANNNDKNVENDNNYACDVDAGQSISETTMPCDSGDNNSSYQDIALTQDKLQSRCWSCHVDLKCNTNMDGKSSPLTHHHQSTSLYVMHAHPILQVPTCSVCTDITYAVETDVIEKIAKLAQGKKEQEEEEEEEEKGKHNDDTKTIATEKDSEKKAREETSSSAFSLDGPDCCSGCGKGIHENDSEEEEDDEKVLLVSCDACPRAFCRKCVSQAHGGGFNGRLATDKLTANSSTKDTPNKDPWMCLHCDAPHSLRSLQIHLEKESASHEEEKSNNENTTTTKEEQRDIKCQQLLEELERLEDELERCEEVDEVYLAERRDEISAELTEGECTIPEKELDGLVNKQVACLEKEWKDHHLRVMDHVVSIQDELESYGQDLLSFYESRQQQASSTLDPAQEFSDNDTGEEEPEWKRKADEELDERDAKAGRRKCVIPGGDRVSEDYVYSLDLEDLDNQDEIDDIQTEDSCLAMMTEKKSGSDIQRQQWTNTDFQSQDPPEIKRKKFQRALKMERMLLEEKQIGIHKLTDTDDKAEVQKYQQSRGGKVRRDEVLMVRSKATSMKQRKFFLKKPASLKKDESSSSSSSSSLLRTGGNMTNETSKNTKPKKRITPFLVSAEPNLPSATLGNRNFNSDLILTSPETMRAALPNNADMDESLYRTVTVAPDLVTKLKEHQVRGIKFMFSNTCFDLCTKTKQSNMDSGNINVGGCILAHNMGLGKTLQVITLLDTLLNHPALEYELEESTGLRRRFIHRVLIIVPANTISNWEQEFEKWVEGKIQVYNLTSFSSDARFRTIGSWYRKGGVLLMTSQLYVHCVKNQNMRVVFLDPGPDLIVLDEAHTMVRGNSTKIAKALRDVRTKRRIALTGTPLQNNLMEYYHMVNWVRPNILGSERFFDDYFNKPIMAGMTSDSSPNNVQLQKEKTIELYKILSPFVHRRDSSALKKELRTMQQVVLVVRQTKLQTMLNRRFKRVYKSNSFLDIYSKIAPILNHPGCLIPASRQQKTRRIQQQQLNDGEQNGSNIEEILLDTSKGIGEKAEPGKCQLKSSDVGPSNSVHSGESGKSNIPFGQNSTPECEELWWESVARKKDVNFCDIKHGYKVVLLLQILAHAQEIGDKVVVFSKCLRTLDFIGNILSSADWGSRLRRFTSIPNIAGLGSWQKDIDYLRIDGRVSPCQRGELVDYFNDEAVKRSKLFLISIEAGGIGINLTAANRVVLFDCHWNPAVTTQALYRCYRYGQSKAVFAYSFIAEGSMEEKIYSRSVNKSGLAARVIDQRHPDRSFTTSDLDLLRNNDEWACCDRCDKWRMLPPEENSEDLPEKWYCEFLSKSDPTFANCDEPERSEHWYKKRFEKQLQEKTKGSQTMDLLGSIDTPAYMMADEAKNEAVSRDDILMRLLSISPDNKKSDPPKTPSTSPEKKAKKRSFISRYHFHDVLLEDRGSNGLHGEQCREEMTQKQNDESDARAIGVVTDRVLINKKDSDQLKDKVDLANSKKSPVSGMIPDKILPVGCISAPEIDALFNSKADASLADSRKSPVSGMVPDQNLPVGCISTPGVDAFVKPTAGAGLKNSTDCLKSYMDLDENVDAGKGTTAPKESVTKEKVQNSSNFEKKNEGAGGKLVAAAASPLSTNRQATVLGVIQASQRQRLDRGTCEAPIDLLSDSSDVE